MKPQTAAVALFGALVLGAGVPWLGMRMLIPSLGERTKVKNYRGRDVFLGLGIVWLIWAGCAIVAGVGVSWLGPDLAGSMIVALTLAGPFALVAFSLGAVDDIYGTGASRGFRGHLTELRRGRLTTGGIKLFGISLAAFVVALVLSAVSPWGVGVPIRGGSALLGAVVLALIAGAAIALTSNLVNLMDLRPGRALKSYSVLAVVGVLSAVFGLGPQAASLVESGPGSSTTLLDLAVLTIFLLGPVLAVWRYDVGETAMLGDAGANPMGAVAGMFIVAGLPRWGLFVYLVLVFALNVASERFSFTAVIEGNKVLSWFDGLGRGSLSDENAPPE
ncbi:MAG: hypothetical protein ACYC6C_05640 [Coriobacteriia bacterium]